jgi:periplasmic glucans biosynthesis protein
LFRRVFLGASAALPLLAVADPAPAADPAPSSTPFDGATVRNMARQLARQPYKAPENTLPPPY